MRTTAAVPAPKQDLTNQLLARFKDLISERVLQPGMKLPPERELAPKFGVSRSSLRHALKVLETMGVVTQRVGDGTYVTANAGRILSEPLEFLLLLDGISAADVIDTRLIVEPELAARAAHQATTEDLR
jgi:GntR family transcriptional repressor for pyruvate dehydrogenase complex